MKKIFLITFLLLFLLFFITGMATVALAHQGNQEITWKLFGTSFLLILVGGVLTAIMGYFGIYLPRFSPPRKEVF
ncbi:hypothetical protein H6776_00365 [Candidatus Nomurabacteria bacterium]|nr:hypothetical protein [Candidatus Nomurabacteria bacterium]